MDDFIKNLKEKLTIDNIVGFMKDAKVIDEHHIKEEDVRKTLEKIDPNNIADAEEIAAKLNEISEQSKAAMQDVKSQSSKLLETAKSSFSVLQKPSEHENAVDDDPYTKDDNILAFFD